jgi:hypothetical protein
MVSPQFGGSAHHPPPKRAEPGQRAGQVNWLESMMATTGDSENMRGCNTVNLSHAWRVRAPLSLFLGLLAILEISLAPIFLCHPLQQAFGRFVVRAA